MSALPRDETAEQAPAWTIDELAGLVGMTVRTIRYYAGLGLIPAAERRGRMAFYDERHRSRLDLVRTMQDQGLTLGSIEQHLRHLPEDTPASEVEMRRALISSWAPVPPAHVDRAELERRAGRALSDEDLERLVELGAVAPHDGLYEAGPMLEVGLGLLDLDIPIESMHAASEAITRHMDELVLELRQIMRSQVLPPMRERHLDHDPAAFAETMTRLRQLTLESVIGNYQRAASGLVDGSLLGRNKEAH